MKLLGTAEAEAEAHLESVLTEDILTFCEQRSGDWFPVWNYPERHQVALAAEAEGTKKEKEKGICYVHVWRHTTSLLDSEGSPV